MSDPIDERLRSYYSRMQTDPPARLEARVSRAMTARPRPHRVATLWRPALGLVSVVAVVALAAAAILGPNLLPGPVAPPSAQATPTHLATPITTGGSPTPPPSRPSFTVQPACSWPPSYVSPAPAESSGCLPGQTPTASPTAAITPDYGELSGVYTRSAALARSYFTSTGLPDGRVLIAGGLGTGQGGSPIGPLRTAELWNPATNEFTPTGSMTVGRYKFTATLLQDGRVLISGGADSSDGAGNLASAEIYDPRTGHFTATGSMKMGRSSQTATLLDDGKVLVAGGAGTLPIPECELYDPATGEFTVTGSMTMPREGATATAVAGVVLLAGGNTVTGAAKLVEPTATAELYDPATGTFSATASMSTPRAGAAAVYLNPVFTLPADGGLMSVRRYGGTGHVGSGATVAVDAVLIAGGTDGSGAALASTEIFYADGNRFAAGPPMRLSRSQPQLVSLKPTQQMVLIVGGEDKGDSVAEVDEALKDRAAGVGPVWSRATGLSGVSAAIPISGTGGQVLLIDRTATAWQMFTQVALTAP